MRSHIWDEKFHTKRTKGITSKTIKFLEILNNGFKTNLVQRKSLFKLYNILTTEPLLYGCEI